MLKQRLKAAGMVVDHLIPAENAIDASLSCGTALAQAMLAARSEANLPFATGQDALDHVAEGNAYLVQARRAFVAAHKALAETRDQLGLRERAFGDTSECPDPSQPHGLLDERPRLRGVQL